MRFSLSMNRGRHVRSLSALLLLLCVWSIGSVNALPSSKGKKGSGATPQSFLRQTNTYSNLSFYYTNRGVLFNNDAVAGLVWPRGTDNRYIFGGGLWFATQKEIQ